MGAVAALEWTQDGGHVDEVVPLAFGALAGGGAAASATRTCSRSPRCCR